MARIASNPQVARPNATLEKLTADALRLYGEASPATVEGDAYMMFIGFANEVVEDICGHPYWTGGQIDYYDHPSDIRAIPDTIVIAGLLYYLALQQGSQKMPVLLQRYNHVTNRTLYQLKYNGGYRHNLGVLDKMTPDGDADLPKVSK